MYRTLSLSLAFLAILLLNTNAQENSAAALDSMEKEILKILNDKTWEFRRVVNERGVGGYWILMDLKKEITVSNHKLIFVTKKDVKTISMTFEKANLAQGGEAPKICLYIDSLYISQNYSDYSPGTQGTVSRETILSKNQKVRDLFSLFKAYQSYPVTERYKKDLKKFETLADDYRNTEVKPTISEEQRRLIVQANALNDKHSYSGALEKYKQAIELNPVSYPQAYYNMALIAAQNKDYKYAILNMKKYLLLVPDAQDSRAGQDKIYEWEIEETQ